MILCGQGKINLAPRYCGNAATELHCWGLGEQNFRYYCDDCKRWSYNYDRDSGDLYKSTCRYYRPVVQPVVGSEDALCVEVFMHAACRLLRACEGWERPKTST